MLTQQNVKLVPQHVLGWAGSSHLQWEGLGAAGGLGACSHPGLATDTPEHPPAHSGPHSLKDGQAGRLLSPCAVPTPRADRLLSVLQGSLLACFTLILHSFGTTACQMLHRTGLGKENQHPIGKTGTRMVEESEGNAKGRHQVEEKQGGCGGAGVDQAEKAKGEPGEGRGLSRGRERVAGRGGTGEAVC